MQGIWSVAASLSCRSDAGCCGVHWTKVSRLSKAYRCDGTAGLALPSDAPARLANDIFLRNPVHSAQTGECFPLSRVSFASPIGHDQNNISPTCREMSDDHGVCMTMPLMKPSDNAIRCCFSALATLRVITRWLRVHVMSELNWHFGYLLALWSKVVATGVPFLFFVGKAGSQSL